jgi:hypothetical protein
MTCETRPTTPISVAKSSSLSRRFGNPGKAPAGTLHRTPLDRTQPRRSAAVRFGQLEHPSTRAGSGAHAEIRCLFAATQLLPCPPDECSSADSETVEAVCLVAKRSLVLWCTAMAVHTRTGRNWPNLQLPALSNPICAHDRVVMYRLTCHKQYWSHRMIAQSPDSLELKDGKQSNKLCRSPGAPILMSMTSQSHFDMPLFDSRQTASVWYIL